jgi:hypothetical protein
LLGCWVAGLLGCWVAGLLGCWVASCISELLRSEVVFVRNDFCKKAVVSFPKTGLKCYSSVDSLSILKTSRFLTRSELVNQLNYSLRFILRRTKLL